MNDAKYPGSPGGVACFHLDKDDNKILLFKILKLSHKTNQFDSVRSMQTNVIFKSYSLTGNTLCSSSSSGL